MSRAEFPKPSDLAPEDELVPPPVEGHHAEPQPSPRRTGRRWEIGFFARKVIEGRLAYLKLLKSLGYSVGGAEQPPADQSGTRGGGGQQEFSIPEVRPLAHESGHTGDGGPVGKTSLEFGFFANATDEETGDSDS